MVCGFVCSFQSESGGPGLRYESGESGDCLACSGVRRVRNLYTPPTLDEGVRDFGSWLDSVPSVELSANPGEVRSYWSHLEPEWATRGASADGSCPWWARIGQAPGGKQ